MIAGGKLIKKASYATIRKRNTMFFGHIMRRYAFGDIVTTGNIRGSG